MKKLFISFLLVCLTFISAQLAFAENNFSDLANDHPYLNAIEDFATNEIVIGYPDGEFKPDQLVTRAEFIKIAVIYLEEKPESEIVGFKDCFDDVTGHWAEHYICYAYSSGIVEGDGNTGLFDPNRNVNFVEAAKMIDYIFYGKRNAYIDPWYAPSIATMEMRRAIPPSVIGLDQFVSRSESVEMLYRSNNMIEPFEEYNYFPEPEYLFTRTVQHLSEYNSIIDNTIVDKNFTFVASDVGEMSQIEDEICMENCPWRNEDYIFHNQIMFYDVNFDELEFLNEMIAVDDSLVYYFLPTGAAGYIEDVDLRSFEIPENFKLYYDDFGYDSYNLAVEPSPYLTVYQIKDKNNIYLILNSDLFDGKGNLWRQALSMEDSELQFVRNDDLGAVLIVPNPDNEEVEFVGKHHFKHGDKVYFLIKEIEDVDADSFGLFDDGLFGIIQRYSRDENNVYYEGVVVEDADPETFTSTDSSYYYMDKNYVFSNLGLKLEGIESDNYEVVNWYAVLGEDLVYMFGNLVEGMDPDTFVYISIDCIRDAENYYLEDYVLEKGGRNVYKEVTEEEWIAECLLVIPLLDLIDLE